MFISNNGIQDLCVSGWGKPLLHGVKPLLPNPQKKYHTVAQKNSKHKMTRRDLQATDLEENITTRNYSGDQKKMEMSGHTIKKEKGLVERGTVDWNLSWNKGTGI